LKIEVYEYERKGMEEEWYFVSLSHFLDLRKSVGESIMEEEQFYKRGRRDESPVLLKKMIKERSR